MFYKKIIRFCFILTFLFILFFPKIRSTQTFLSNKEEKSIKSILTYHNEEYNSLSLEVSKVKTLKGLNQEIYKLVELSPTGYIILLNNGEEVIEYSLNSTSPYINYEKQIFYGGPCCYSVQTKDKVVSISNNQKYGQQAYQSLRTGDSVDSAVPTDPTDGGYPELTKENVINFFKNMSCPGTPNTPDTCGYIGLGMLIAFQAKFHNALFLSTLYWTNANQTDLIPGASSIAQHLYNINPYDLTTASIIGSTLNKYCLEVNISAVTFTKVAPNYLDIKSKVENCIPVQLFGIYSKNNNNKINHSIIAYAFENNMVRAHLGWDGNINTSVYISSSNYTIGEMFTINKLN